MPEHAAELFVVFPVPEGDEAAVPSQGQNPIAHLLHSQQRVFSFVLHKLLLEIVVLVNVPDPHGRVVARTGQLQAILEENDLRYLFLVGFVSMLQGQLVPVPQPD
jgi:hypothetical protein